MGQVRRKRPWEENIEDDKNFLAEFIGQMIICTFLCIGVLIMLNTNESAKWQKLIKQEVTKEINTEDVYAFIAQAKETLDHYIDRD